MTEQQMEAIAGGYHGDAFAVLGPHEKANGSKDEWEVTAFLPQAQNVEIVLDGKTVPAERVHEAGIYVAKLDAQPGQYQLRITDYNGIKSEVEDVYRFGPILSDFDLHLHSEGTNYEGYNSF